MKKVAYALGAFLKQPAAIAGMVTALMFQLIFSLVWMTGYDGVTDNVSKLKLAVVLDDPAASALFGPLAAQLPFDVAVIDSLPEAEARLDNRDVHLVMRIPEGFLQAAASSAPATVEFLVNESNPVMLKGMTETIADRLTSQLNQALAASDPERITANIRSLNPVGNFADQMVPLMIVIASYVGAMVMGMNMYQSARALQGQVARWPRHIAWALVNAGSAAVIALAGTTFIHLLGSGIGQGFFLMWAFQTLFLLAFMFVSHLFVLLFGMPGMLFNIAMLSVQLVASGAMVPRELLPGGFRAIGDFLPATHAVEGSMNILFGGPGAGQASLALILFTVTAVAIAGCTVALKREKSGLPAADAAL